VINHPVSVVIPTNFLAEVKLRTPLFCIERYLRFDSVSTFKKVKSRKIRRISGQIANRRSLKGIRRVMDHGEMDHLRSGELILEADDGFWFAYQWWDNAKNAPDYATHVDIHNKPGFDPCELFMSLWPPMSITQDNSKISGTHGISDPEIAPIYWGTTFSDSEYVKTILDGAELVRHSLDS